MAELSEAQKRMLRRLPGCHGITNRTLTALERRGLVICEPDGKRFDWYPMWECTPAGRAALEAE